MGWRYRCAEAACPRCGGSLRPCGGAGEAAAQALDPLLVTGPIGVARMHPGTLAGGVRADRRARRGHGGAVRAERPVPDDPPAFLPFCLRLLVIYAGFFKQFGRKDGNPCKPHRIAA